MAKIRVVQEVVKIRMPMLITLQIKLKRVRGIRRIYPHGSAPSVTLITRTHRSSVRSYPL